MLIKRHLVGIAGASVVLLGCMGTIPGTSNDAVAASVIAEGKAIVVDRRKGNCLACHMIENEESPGNIAPPLIAMKARFQEKAKLREQIHDPTKRNPATSMPPFGKHKILSDSEVDKVVEYLWTL